LVINDIPFIELDIDIDYDKLLSEWKAVEDKYSFAKYKTKYWQVRRKYAKAWSGISLVGSDGDLYSDMYEGDSSAASKTELRDVCPYYYELISKLGGDGFRARIMRISPKESLVWHSHVQEHRQPEWQLTCQIPIVMPNDFEYCVLHKDEFRWWKRFHRPDWLKRVWRKKLDVGKAYIFNSYHYHNVYNYSNEYRVTLMLYLDLRDPKVRDLIERSL